MKFLILLLLASAISQSASAAIIGMLVEDSKTKVELESIVFKGELIRLTVTSPYEIEKLLLSRYIGGEGGNALKMLNALENGEPPPFSEVSEWMPEDKGRTVVKLGIFTSDEKFSFTSFFTGLPTQIPYRTAKRVSIKKELKNFKHVFEFAVYGDGIVFRNASAARALELRFVRSGR